MSSSSSESSSLISGISPRDRSDQAPRSLSLLIESAEATAPSLQDITDIDDAYVGFSIAALRTNTRQIDEVDQTWCGAEDNNCGRGECQCRWFMFILMIIGIILLACTSVSASIALLYAGAILTGVPVAFFLLNFLIACIKRANCTACCCSHLPMRLNCCVDTKVKDVLQSAPGVASKITQLVEKFPSLKEDTNCFCCKTDYRDLSANDFIEKIEQFGRDCIRRIKASDKPQLANVEFRNTLMNYERSQVVASLPSASTSNTFDGQDFHPLTA